MGARSSVAGVGGAFASSAVTYTDVSNRVVRPVKNTSKSTKIGTTSKSTKIGTTSKSTRIEK